MDRRPPPAWCCDVQLWDVILCGNPNLRLDGNCVCDLVLHDKNVKAASDTDEWHAVALRTQNDGRTTGEDYRRVTCKSVSVEISIG